MISIRDWLALAVGVAMVLWASRSESIPPAAGAYKIEIKRASTRVWGPNPPVAFLAGQVEQESGWNPNARSPFARGLTQFTPGTEAAMKRAYPDLAVGDALDARWALSAQALYMRELYQQLGGKNDCHAMLFAAMGYNGGPGWVLRDRALADDPMDYGTVRTQNSGRNLAAWRENRDYPVKIAFRRQPGYISWGGARCL